MLYLIAIHTATLAFLVFDTLALFVYLRFRSSGVIRVIIAVLNCICCLYAVSNASLWIGTVDLWMTRPCSAERAAVNIYISISWLQSE